MIIKLTKNTPSFKKGTARAKWFTAIKRYHGKDVEAFVAATTKKPPVLNRHGEAESPNAWVSYFERAKVIKLT